MYDPKTATPAHKSFDVKSVAKEIRAIPKRSITISSSNSIML